MLEQALFQEAVPILKIIEEKGYEAYFVGGSVRDVLLHKTISDIDIATSAFPQEIKHIFKRTVDVGIEHGTVLVLYQNSQYEVTTFRTESTYQDYRRPDSVTFVRSLEEDLKRRDFTMNALAIDCRGKLYDFHNGQSDIANQCIRAVGDAHERFHEDALRMMRAIRFSGQLDFYIEEHTKAGIQNYAHLLEKISVERVCVEWQKLMSSKNRHRGLMYFIETKLFEYCPGFKHYEQAIQRFSQTNVVYTENAYNWAVLLYCIGETYEKSQVLLAMWKLSNHDKDTALKLYNILQWRQTEQWTVDELFKTGETLAVVAEDMAFRLHIIKQTEDVSLLYQQLPIKSVKDLALTGRDIMALLHKESGGQYLGNIIETMKQQVLHGFLKNDVSQLSQWVTEHYTHLKEG